MATKKMKKDLWTKIKTFLDHIKVYMEYYFAIVSAAGLIWGAFVVYDRWRDNSSQLQEDVREIIVTQREEAKIDSLLLYKQTEIEQKLIDLQTETRKNSENIQTLQNSYIKYISNDRSLSKEDFLKYMEGLSYDVKKNSLVKTTPTQNQTMTTQVD